MLGDGGFRDARPGGAAWPEGGQGAQPPEADQALQAGEDADEAGLDEGMPRGQWPVFHLCRAELGEQGGEVPVQGLRVVL